jgi:hypothetical protein
VVVPMRAAPAQTIASHVVVDVASLDVRSTKAGRGWDMLAGASGAKEEAATVDEVAIREAEMRLTETVSRQVPACRRWRVSSLARCDASHRARLLTQDAKISYS